MVRLAPNSSLLNGKTGSSLVLRATSSRLGLFESSKVLEHIAGVAAKDGPADEPVQRAEDRAPRVSGELAGPDHLDAASTLTRRCPQLPGAPRDRVDVRVCDGCLDGAWSRPVVAASLPIDADAGFRSFGDVGPGLAELVYLKVRERDCWKDVRPPSSEVVAGGKHSRWREGALRGGVDRGHGGVMAVPVIAGRTNFGAFGSVVRSRRSIVNPSVSIVASVGRLQSQWTTKRFSQFIRSWKRASCG